MVAETGARRRRGLARELFRAGDIATLAVLVAVLSSPDPSGHVHAAESLFKVGEIGDAAVTTQAFAQHENFRLHLMAAASLARRGDKEPLTVIRTVLRGSDPDGIMLAGWTLGQIGDDADIEPLRSRLADAPTPLIRTVLEHALALRGDAAGLEPLTRNLTSADEASRAAAANTAGEARAQATAAAIVPLPDDHGLDVRILAAHSLLVLDRPKGAVTISETGVSSFTVTGRSPRSVRPVRRIFGSSPARSRSTAAGRSNVLTTDASGNRPPRTRFNPNPGAAWFGRTLHFSTDVHTCGQGICSASRRWMLKHRACLKTSLATGWLTSPGTARPGP